MCIRDRQYTDKKILQHIDPTFLLNKEQWETFSQDLPENINEPFIFIHILKRQPELIKFAENLSVKLGCKILMSDQRLSLIHISMCIRDSY